MLQMWNVEQIFRLETKCNICGIQLPFTGVSEFSRMFHLAREELKVNMAIQVKHVTPKTFVLKHVRVLTKNSETYKSCAGRGTVWKCKCKCQVQSFSPRVRKDYYRRIWRGISGQIKLTCRAFLIQEQGFIDWFSRCNRLCNSCVSRAESS